MKYFILTNGDKNPFPQIINWSQTIDVRKMTRKEYQKFPPFILLNMQSGLDGIFPDVLEKPFLLLSRKAMEVVTLYDPDIPFLFISLFDSDKGECALYYCPILKEECCLASIPGPGKREIILNRENMSGIPLFRVRAGTENIIVIRMDLAESLLEREADGIKLKELYLAENKI